MGHSTHPTFDDSKTIPAAVFFGQTGLVPKLYSSWRQIKRGSPYWPQEQKGGTWEVVSEFEGIKSMVPKINEQNNLSKIVCNCEAYLIQSRRGTCKLQMNTKVWGLFERQHSSLMPRPQQINHVRPVLATGKWWAVTLGTTNQWPPNLLTLLKAHSKRG